MTPMKRPSFPTVFTFLASLFLAACVGGTGESPADDTPATPPGSNGARCRPEHEGAAAAAAPAEPVIEWPEDAEARRVLGLVAKDHLENLWRLVGRYVSGEGAIYRGTFHARNELGGGPGVIDGEAVTATLGSEREVLVDGKITPARALTVIGATHRVRLAQLAAEPARTHFTLVTDERTTYGVTAACDGCVPALDPSQPSLMLSEAVGEGMLGDGSSSFRVRTSGTLERIEPSALTFADFVAAAAPMSDRHTMDQFTKSSDVHVRLARSSHSEVVDDNCQRTTWYRLEWFVDPRSGIRYGIRRMAIENATTTCCPAGGCPGQAS